MCGIAGIIQFVPHNRDSAMAQITNMADTMAHRGPDEQGVYVDDHAALGHKRLRIIDLSTGQQPMASQDQTLHIVFNGEVYNFQEIKKELVRKNYRFSTTSDTEVVLNAYIEWKEACVKKFNGMFAFAIWDSRKKTLFAARDRVGKKPFYYFWDGKRFAFASELKAILAAGLSQKKIDPKALDCYFSFGYIPVPYSIYDDISKLPSAHTLTLTSDGLNLKKYWHLDFGSTRDLTMDQASDRLTELLYDAVKLRLISDVPLGAFLSGGIDSSLVVSFMAKISSQPVATHTIGFDETGFNELPAAGMVADFLKTDHHQFIVNPDASQTLEKIAAFFDEPFADSSALPTWHVCRMAGKNVTVALSGDGGDEGFGGYTFRYLPHQMESRLRSVLPAVLRTPLFSLIGALYPAGPGLPRFLRLKTIFENLAVSDAQAFYNDLIWLRQKIRQNLYAKGFMDALKGFTPAETVMPVYQKSSGTDPVSRSQHTDIQCYMTDDVLVKVDRMSMAHSLEVRNPLLDYRILEFAAALPLNLKVSHGSGKRLLRHLAAKHLPPQIIDLPKQGFAIPAAHWLRKDLNAFAHDHIFNSEVVLSCMNPAQLHTLWSRHQQGRADHSVLLWGLMMLGLWEKQFHKGPLQ
jgi:asparagine synthase (glutamine-hydrolysing)